MIQISRSDQRILAIAGFCVGGALISRALSTLQDLGISPKKLLSLDGLAKHQFEALQLGGGLPLAVGSPLLYWLLNRETSPPLPPGQFSKPRQPAPIIGQMKLEQPGYGTGMLEESGEDYASFTIGSTTVEVLVQDIVQARTDAIVNAANSQLALGSGVAGAIAAQDKEDKIQQACFKITKETGKLEEGQAAITPGWPGGPSIIIHAVGPVYDPKRHERCVRTLRSAYISAFQAAEMHGVTSVAIPFLSSNIFGYTTDKGSHLVALKAVQDYLTDERPQSLTKIQFVSLQRDLKVRRDFIRAIENSYPAYPFGHFDKDLIKG